MKTKELSALLKVLQKHGVETYKQGDLELKISPLKYVAPMQDVIDAPKSTKEVSEDDLYYSASTFKTRIK